jgi:hypothetical protein
VSRKGLGPESHILMFVQSVLRTRDGKEIPVKAVVDTGAEVNLVRRGLLDGEYLHAPSKYLALTGINQDLISGGYLEFSGKILMDGVESESKRPLAVSMSFRALEVEMDADCILSYPWLANHHVDVYPKRHGIMVHGLETLVWVSAMKLGKSEGKREEVRPTVVQMVTESEESPPQGLLCAARHLAV